MKFDNKCVGTVLEGYAMSRDAWQGHDEFGNLDSGEK